MQSTASSGNLQIWRTEPLTEDELIDMVYTINQITNNVDIKLRISNMSQFLHHSSNSFVIPLAALTLAAKQKLLDQNIITDSNTISEALSVEEFLTIFYVPCTFYGRNQINRIPKILSGPNSIHLTFLPATFSHYFFPAQEPVTGLCKLPNGITIRISDTLYSYTYMDIVQSYGKYLFVYDFYTSVYSKTVLAIPYKWIGLRSTLLPCLAVDLEQGNIIANNIRLVNIEQFNIPDDYNKYNEEDFARLIPQVKFDSNTNTYTMQQVIDVKQTALADYLAEQIRVRYGFFERPRSGLSNVVLDSFFPRLLYTYKFDIAALKLKEQIPATGVAISQMIADTLNVPKIPINQLIRILGYTNKDIVTLLKAVKRKNLSMVLAGVGGTGMNTIYWLDELCQLTHVVNLFKTIYVYESEKVEISNMLRFPFGYAAYEKANTAIDDLYSDKGVFKLAIAEQFVERLCRNKPCYIPRYINTKTIYGDEWLIRDSNGVYKTKPEYFIYGAPEISYRNSFSALGNFISATHADNGCSIWLNPIADTELQVESYGMIQLGSFFMNQLRMTIGLLELLASDQPLNEQDKNILNYSFDGSIILPVERQYNWQINHNMRMLTEEQASL